MDMRQTHVDHMRKCDQATTNADHRCMPGIGMVHTHEHANDEQDDSGYKDQQRAIAAMFSRPINQADRGEHDGETDEGLFKRVIGQKAKTQRRKYAENQRQQSAMNRTKHGRKRAKAIDAAFNAPI